jgi:prepilin-type N-terminal cleavage/methylation domain-containing protein
VSLLYREAHSRKKGDAVSTTGREARGFTLIELLMVIAIIALLISILLPGLGHARKSARLLLCKAGLNQYGTAMQNYATNSRDVTNALSWKPRVAYSEWPDLNINDNNYVRVQAAQAADIVRRVRQDPTYQRVTNRMMNRNFLHLPLVDGGYFSGVLPEPVTACAEDRSTRLWQRHIDDIQTAIAITQNPDIGAAPQPAFLRMLPFWSTYQFVPNSWSHEQLRSPLRQGSGYAGAHLLYGYSPSGTILGPRRLTDVSFPSQKVWVFDLWDRHNYKRPIWHAYDMARQPLLMFDGSVQNRRTDEANRGWTPPNGGPTRYTYWPRIPGEPPTLSGNASDLVWGYYRWTRGGLKGVDFGGGEVRRW